MNRRNAIMAIAGSSLGFILNKSHAEVKGKFKCNCEHCEFAHANGFNEEIHHGIDPHDIFLINVAGRVLEEHEPKDRKDCKEFNSNFVVVKLTDNKRTNFYFIDEKVFSEVFSRIENYSARLLASYSLLYFDISGKVRKFRYGKLFNTRWESNTNDLYSFEGIPSWMSPSDKASFPDGFASNKLKSNYKIYS